MRVSVIFLAVAIGSATGFAGVRTDLDAGTTRKGEVYHATLGAWVRARSAPPALHNEAGHGVTAAGS